jgi:hypothetical protein
MADPIDISNMALSNVGVRSRIASLSEASEEARVCNLHYGLAVERCLTLFPWPFATRRQALALIETSPNSEWAYRFALPNDCVEARYIEGSSRNIPVESKVPFQVEAAADLSQQTVLTDEPAPVLVYTTKNLGAGQYPAYFVNLVSWELAAAITLPLRLSEESWKLAITGARQAMTDSRAHALNQGQEDQPLDSEFVRARE